MQMLSCRYTAWCSEDMNIQSCSVASINKGRAGIVNQYQASIKVVPYCGSDGRSCGHMTAELINKLLFNVNLYKHVQRWEEDTLSFKMTAENQNKFRINFIREFFSWEVYYVISIMFSLICMLIVNYFEYHFRWIPESARWLLANGKVERAQYYLDRCAKFNTKEKLSTKLKLEASLSLMLNSFFFKTYMCMCLCDYMNFEIISTSVMRTGAASICQGFSVLPLEGDRVLHFQILELTKHCCNKRMITVTSNSLNVHMGM